MSNWHNQRARFLGASVVVALGVCFALFNSARSADEPPPAVAAKPEPKYMGANSCALCHAKSDRPPVTSDLVTLEEFSTWDHRDQHRHAFDVLDCPRARDMEKSLGWEKEPVKTNRKCLACHSIDINKDSAGETLADPKAQTAAVAQGVSCEACHGPAERWIDPHWKTKLTPEQKHARGMTNVGDPIARTELCLSCHLGNISEGKFVTHDMFAAGHPPLPAFEIATFLDQMPPHWRTDKALPRAQAVALEGLVMQRASLQLLTDVPSHPQYAGDFALHDCSACHHELQVKSARQARGYAGVPGRPPLRRADSPLEPANLPLNSADEAGPFADPDLAAAKSEISELTAAIASLQSKPADPAGLLKRLCADGFRLPLDFEGAWQLAGAIQTVAREMEGSPPSRADRDLNEAVEKLSELVHVPAAPPPAAKTGCDHPRTLWQSGDGFDSTKFRQQLAELAKLLK